jgi:hypothetical protein
LRFGEMFLSENLERKNNMKRLTIVFLIMIAVSCERDKSPAEPTQNDFIITNHIIGKMGSTMRLGIKVPETTYYYLSADTSKIVPDDSLSFIVPLNEMVQIAQSLSDTTVFHWEFMTAVTPYPSQDCVLFVFLDFTEEYMCSIGSGDHAGEILHKLIKPLTGTVREVLDTEAEA